MSSEFDRAFNRRAREKQRVAEQYPGAEMLGFATATRYLIRLDGEVWAVSTENPVVREKVK